MNPQPVRHPQKPGNTATYWISARILAVVGVLAACVFPIANGIRKRNLANTKNTAHNLKNATQAYFTEYRKYPVKDAAENNDTLIHSDHALMDALLAADNQTIPGGLNPRRISFYSGMRIHRNRGGTPKKGLWIESGGAGELWDPYSNYYKVLMDTDYNNSIDSPETPGVPIKATIIVWSAGPDGDFDTWKDNVKTW